MKKLIVGLAVFLVSTAAMSDGYYRARTIIGAGIFYKADESMLLIDFDGSKAGMPECANTGRLAITSSVPHYKELVSIAMTAYVSKESNVDIYVKETCDYSSNSQDILGIKMGSMVW
tara:strand:+ start:715 stop:1065 length:351 start_codon:yes stop_codon:yes gene_type:complete